MVDLSKVRVTDLWYVIGYIATDGYLSIDGRHINITSKDRKHLYLIRNALYLKNKIGRKARGNNKDKRFSQLQFGDVKFYRYLVNLGFIQQKSLNLGIIQVENSFFVDFLRGVIDGDGNISTWIHRTNNHRQWCLRIFSASPIFAQWLSDKIKEIFGIKGKLYVRKMKNRDNPGYILKFGKLDARVIFQSIYYPGCLALERKYFKAVSCLQG